MSEDPKLFDAGDYNLFRYCHNDPIDFADPMGLADQALPAGPNHASPLIELSKRQMQFDRSLGAVSVGQNQQFFQAIANFIKTARSDAAGVSLKDIAKAVFTDAREATDRTVKSIRHDQYGRLRSTETAFAEYPVGSSLHRRGPIIWRNGSHR